MFGSFILITLICTVLGPVVRLDDRFEEDFRGNGQSRQRSVTTHGNVPFSFSDSVLLEAISSEKIKMDPRNPERHIRSLVRVSSFACSLFSVD